MGRLLLLSFLALLGTSCALLFPDTHSTREDAQTLKLGEWHKDFLHCDRYECRDWYTIVLEKRGELRIDVYSPAGDGLPDYSLLLEDAEQKELAAIGATGKSPRQIRKRLDPGTYRLRLFAAEGDQDRLEYEVRADLKPRTRKSTPKPAPAPKPKPPPEPVWIDAEVLEVERSDDEPRFVLIDAGSPQGIRSGQKGRLVQGQKQIAEIEVVDVYDAGSRARILGRVAAKITIDTRAQIAVPAPQQ